MSLIQEALTKTQSKAALSSSAYSAGTRPRIQSRPTQSLTALDQDVEAHISKIRRIVPPEGSQKRGNHFLVVSIVLIFLSGVLYWAQANNNVEEVPPAVVSIHREVIPPKKLAPMPMLAPKPVIKTQIPEAPKKVIPVKPALFKISPSDSRGMFFLSGIAGGGAQPYAVVNGQILRAGDSVDNKAVLESIGDDHVILNYRNQPIRLTIKR